MPDDLLFDRCFNFLVGPEIEGGYSNRSPDVDPGGETIYGISRRYHPEMWVDGRPTIAQAKTFYRNTYWIKNGCHKLSWPVCLLVFDFCVNSGNAIKVLQRALNISVDGMVGPQTIAALERANQKEVSLALLNASRIRYLSELPNVGPNALGWYKRVLLVMGECARAFSGRV